MHICKLEFDIRQSIIGRITDFEELLTKRGWNWKQIWLYLSFPETLMHYSITAGHMYWIICTGYVEQTSGNVLNLVLIDFTINIMLVALNLKSCKIEFLTRTLYLLIAWYCMLLI